MSPAPEKYAARSDADVLRLVVENPFAWVVGEDRAATGLPLRPVVQDGRLTGFLGHFARSNPQVAALRAAPRATLLFMGPHAYVSPSWMADRTQAPTWNYASAAFDCELVFIETADELRALMDDLVGAMERGREKAWDVAEMGERYERLSQGVVGFRAFISDQRAVFKLGQDERDAEFAEIVAGLRAEGHQLLADWMAAFGAGRS